MKLKQIWNFNLILMEKEGLPPETKVVPQGYRNGIIITLFSPMDVTTIAFRVYL